MNRISTSILVLALMSLLVSCEIPENTSTGSDSTGTESDGTGTESDGTSTESDGTSMAWVVSTFAGSEAGGFADGIGTAAKFNLPTGVAVDSSGNVYVVDTHNHRIRKITPADRIENRVVITLAGSTAQFFYPYGVAVDSSGNVYVADLYNHRIRKITPAGVVSTLAGSGTAGHEDGTGTAAKFNYPYGVAVDSSGNIYVADYGNHRIRKITSTGMVSTLAGSGDAGSANGTGTATEFNGPIGVAVDSSGNVYVADTNNHRIRKITPADRIEDRVVSIFAGSGAAGFADGTGTAAKFNLPTGVAVDSSGNVYVADADNNRIRKITPADRIEDRTVSTLAGSDTKGFADGTGTAAEFNYPRGVAVDSSGNVYVADAHNHRIRKLEYKVP